MAKTNPNKANQYKPDPRQGLFISYYLNPKSKTFSNAYQSAIKAGYKEKFAINILNQDLKWLQEYLDSDKYDRLLKKAEKNLDTLLDEKVDKKVKADITKFVAKGLNKKKWSERFEHTGADGADLLPQPLLGGESNKDKDNGIQNNSSNNQTPSTKEEA